MRPLPGNIITNASWPPPEANLSDWAWETCEHVTKVRQVLARRTGLRHRAVYDDDYGLWFIEVGS